MIRIFLSSLAYFCIVSVSFAASNDSCVDFSGRWKGSCSGIQTGMFMKQDGCKGFYILDGNQYVEFGKVFQFPEPSGTISNTMVVNLSPDRSSLHVAGAGIAPANGWKH